MAEARSFQMHEKLLLDVIKKQAGTIEKAVLEGVMNSIEAGATQVVIFIDAESVRIEDDGKGFRNRQEIELFFETFGQPHEESEGKKWAQFRMGRGQMFAFGKNHWKTGPFEMLVDINTRLGYDLEKADKPHAGCSIRIDLYKALSERDIYSIQREIATQVKYVEVPVMVNDKQVNSRPADGTWDAESDENAYIRLNEDSPNLTVYNMGVFVRTFDNHRFGIGGTVVSKKRLDVNFARNDIMADCPVWRAIRKTVEASAGVERIKTKKKLNDAERINMIEKLVSGELNVGEAMSMPLFVDVSGTPWSADKILKSDFRHWSYAERGSRKGDRLIQTGRALVLNEALLAAFGCPLPQVFTKRWRQGVSFFDVEGPEYMPFEKLAKDVNDQFIVLTQKEWRKSEYIWSKVIEKLQQYLARYDDQRTIQIGDSCGKAKAWTDGKHYIVFDREFLARCSFSKNRGRININALMQVAAVLAHELCHDTDSRENLHSPEFFEAFHNLCVNKDKFPSKLATAIDKVYGYLIPAAIERLFRDARGQEDSSQPEPEQDEEPEQDLERAACPQKEDVMKSKTKSKSKPSKPKKVSARKSSSKDGRTAAEINDPKEILKIAKMYKKLGGDLSFEAIELVPGLNLRVANGMTAYRIVGKAKKLKLLSK